METVKTLVTSLCVVLIFSGVAMMLTTEGTMKKSVKTLISVIIISVIVNCVFGVSEAVKGIDFSSNNINLNETSFAFSKIVQNQSIMSIESAVKSVIDEEFEKSGINSAEVLTIANITEDNRIYITKVEILCNTDEVVLCRNVMDKLSVCDDVNITERK